MRPAAGSSLGPCIASTTQLLFAFLVVSSGCVEKNECNEPNGTTVIALDSATPEAGPEGVIESLLICQDSRVDVGVPATFVIRVSEIRGDLLIGADVDTIRFPNLRSAEAIVAGNTDLVFDALTNATSLQLKGSGRFTAPLLVALDTVYSEEYALETPQLSQLASASIAGGSVDFSGVASADALQIYAQGPVNLSGLADVGTLELGTLASSFSLQALRTAGQITIQHSTWMTFEMPTLARVDALRLVSNSELANVVLPENVAVGSIVAKENPKLRDCDMRALAGRAGVAEEDLELENNSDASCP